MHFINFSGGRDAALGVPVRQDGMNVVKAPFFRSPDLPRRARARRALALGDGDSAVASAVIVH
jgi:hypothetical protein